MELVNNFLIQLIFSYIRFLNLNLGLKMDIGKDLFLGIAKGDVYSFEKLHKMYSSLLFRFVNNFIHSPEDSEEIVQEVFLILWKNRESLIEVDYPKSYIYTIAKHKTFDYLAKVAKDQKMKQMMWATMKVSECELEDVLNAKESSLLIDNAIKLLSKQKQVIFNLSRVEHKSHEEISLILGLSKSRVKNVIVEVMKHIRFYLKNIASFVFLISFIK